MFHYAYADVMQDSVSEAKLNEREAFDRSLSLMAKAQEKGTFSLDTITAVTFVRQLWSVLIDDLSSAENELTDELKASLISLGIWMHEQADKIMKREIHDFSGMMQVTSTVRVGLA